jgi:hypothetical protein
MWNFKDTLWSRDLYLFYTWFCLICLLLRKIVKPISSALDVNSTDIGRNDFYVLFFSGEYLSRDLN